MILCVDHIKPIGHVRRMTASIYHEIINQPEVREKYQLLCRNCNWRKMIINNERAPAERQFALKQEHDALMERVALLEHKITIREKIRIKEKIIIRRTDTQTEAQLENIILPQVQQLLNDKSGKLDVNKMRIFLRTNGIRISSWKAYVIKGNIEAANPQLFEEP